MTFRQAGIAVGIVLVGITHTVSAQSAASRTASAATPGVVATAVDVSRLPVDISRIEKHFRQATIREDHEGLNLRYFVDVYAKAPEIVLFTPEDNLVYGPVPYGAPTHGEMLRMMTPIEHRTPAANFGNLLRWLADRDKK